MTLIQLKYILTIAETKSLNKAAEQLYVSQPSLTNALKELEKEIGITIFFRSGRGVTLTNDGVEFLTYARELYHSGYQVSLISMTSCLETVCGACGLFGVIASIVPSSLYVTS